MDIDTPDKLSLDAIKRIQNIVGTLLYYGHAVNPTLLTALSSVSARQTNSTTAVAKSCQQLLDYVATHPNAGISYKACNMILAVHTNTFYLSEHAEKVAIQATTISPMRATKLLPMAPYSPYCPSLDTSCHLHLKQNLLHLTTAANLPSLFAQLSKK